MSLTFTIRTKLQFGIRRPFTRDKVTTLAAIVLIGDPLEFQIVEGFEPHPQLAIRTVLIYLSYSVCSNSLRQLEPTQTNKESFYLFSDFLSGFL